MRILVAGKAGIKDITARDLISDLIFGLAENDELILTYVPYEREEGTETVYKTMLKSSWSDVFEGFPERYLPGDVLLVLDPATEPELVNEALKVGVPVFDLSRGLFPVVASVQSAEQR